MFNPDARPVFDEKDELIAKERLQAWDLRKGPRVGDFCVLPNGRQMRFSHRWDDGLQISHPSTSGFYLGKHGYVSFLGSLYPVVPNEDILETELTAMGGFWFFHHDRTAAHNGVYFAGKCRVFKAANSAKVQSLMSWDSLKV